MKTHIALFGRLGNHAYAAGYDADLTWLPLEVDAPPVEARVPIIERVHLTAAEGSLSVSPDLTPNALIDRMAAALIDSEWPHARAAPGDTQGRLIVPTWLLDRARSAARAALAAAREPTTAMIERGWQEGMAGFGEGEEPEPVWRAMIDEALR